MLLTHGADPTQRTSVRRWWQCCGVVPCVVWCLHEVVYVNGDMPVIVETPPLSLLLRVVCMRFPAGALLLGVSHTPTPTHTHHNTTTPQQQDGLTPLQLAMKHKRSSTIELLKSVQGRTSGISDAVAELAKRTGQAVGRRNETHGAAQVNPVAFLGTPADRARRASSGAHAAHKVRAESKSNAAGRSRSTSTSTSTSTGNKPPLPSASARRAAHEAGRSMFFAAVTPSRRTSGAGAPPAIPAPLGAVDVQDVMLSVVTPGGLGQRTAYQQKRAGGGFSEGKNATDPDDWFNAPPPATSTSTGAGQAAAMFNMTPSQIAARARKIARERARKAQASRRPTPTSTTAAFTLTPPPPAPSHRHKVAGGFRRG